MYKLDRQRYLRYSRSLNSDNSNKMIGAIVLQYHVVEKGLTMPETRLGFGKERIIALCRDCIRYIHQYGHSEEQLKHAIGVVLEYEQYHKNENYKLDSEVLASIGQLKQLSDNNVKTAQILKTRKEYFASINNTFVEFSNSRSSIRNFTKEELPLKNIMNALELARNTPSACNRQSWRTYVFTDKSKAAVILEAQGGNRGFGHLSNKLIVITGELGVFGYTNERNQVFVDGGMYAMNLLYTLHANEVAACILNCSFDYKKEQEIKKLCNIKDSEVLIAMIALGVVPNEFKIAVSPRYSLDKTNTIIE